MLPISFLTHPVLLPVLCVVLLCPDLPAPGRPLAVGEARGLIGGELISRKEGQKGNEGGSRHERKKDDLATVWVKTRKNYFVLKRVLDYFVMNNFIHFGPYCF